MSFLHDWKRSTDIDYAHRTAAQQAIIESNQDLLYEIRGLRRDLAKTDGEISEHLAYALIRLIERFEHS